MIREVNKINGLTQENFDSSMLVIYRLAPFVFDLEEAKGVASPADCYLNTELNQQGAYDLIQYIKALAIAGDETWSNSQLIEASQAKTIYIVYADFNQISLNFRKEVVSLDELESEFPNDTVFASYDTSDLGLIALVDELLNWMQL